MTNNSFTIHQDYHFALHFYELLEQKSSWLKQKDTKKAKKKT
jgi:hypothetical protein